MSALSFVSCQSDTYYIKGEARHLNNGTVLYLSKDLNKESNPFDSMIVRNGKFYLKEVIADTPFVSRLYVSGKPEQGIIFFIEPGNIYIELSEKEGRSRVSGTVVNNHWQALNDSVANCDRHIRQLMQQANDSISPQKMSADINRIYLNITRQIRETALRNRDNTLGRFISSHYQ